LREFITDSSKKIRSAPFLAGDDLIVDVHEKTTTIEVRILCTPPAESLGNTQLAATVSAAPVVAKFRRKSLPKIPFQRISAKLCPSLSVLRSWMV
jgi:hypothetical protein